jgi:hypothetical protein
MTAQPANPDEVKAHCRSLASPCHAVSDADSLNQELARRLNEWEAGCAADEDHVQTLAPVLKEALYWTLSAAAGVMAALWWLT